MVVLAGCGDGGPGSPEPTAASTAADRQAAANPRPACFPNCRGKDLSAYRLDGEDLSGGDFTGARWHGARLRGANLSGANLTSANFGPRITGYWHAPATPYDTDAEERPSPEPESPSDLSHANLTGANLTGANLKGANLRLANLQRVKWSNTTCPDGTVTNTGC